MHKNEASALEYRALFIFTEIPFYLEPFHVFHRHAASSSSWSFSHGKSRSGPRQTSPYAHVETIAMYVAQHEEQPAIEMDVGHISLPSCRPGAIILKPPSHYEIMIRGAALWSALTAARLRPTSISGGRAYDGCAMYCANHQPYKA
jgi:hypothetical protein